MTSPTDSILDVTKQLLGIEPQYLAFDLEIITYINAVFSDLQQLGVGPAEGFSIQDNSATWASYTVNENAVNSVRSYMMLRIRLLFDPPATGYTTTSFASQIKELEWRLNVAADTQTSVST